VSSEQVSLIADDAGVRTLTLNRPDRKNAINARLWQQLADALREAARDPESRFCQIFSKRGLSVDLGGSWLLPKLVGLQQAKRLVLLADMIDAEEAWSLGLVTWIKAADEIDAFVEELAGRLAAGPPAALAQSKALLNDGAAVTLREALANEARAQPGNFATADSTEAYAAFAQKREAAFTGRWAIPPRSE
jgi:enoyl-CoA hydratase/carnithine racemase